MWHRAKKTEEVTPQVGAKMHLFSLLTSSISRTLACNHDFTTILEASISTEMKTQQPNLDANCDAASRSDGYSVEPGPQDELEIFRVTHAIVFCLYTSVYFLALRPVQFSRRDHPELKSTCGQCLRSFGVKGRSGLV